MLWKDADVTFDILTIGMKAVVFVTHIATTHVWSDMRYLISKVHLML
jgi:hypothetical protein